MVKVFLSVSHLLNPVCPATGLVIKGCRLWDLYFSRVSGYIQRLRLCDSFLHGSCNDIQRAFHALYPVFAWSHAEDQRCPRGGHTQKVLRTFLIRLSISFALPKRNGRKKRAPLRGACRANSSHRLLAGCCGRPSWVCFQRTIKGFFLSFIFYWVTWFFLKLTWVIILCIKIYIDVGAVN